MASTSGGAPGGANADRDRSRSGGERRPKGGTPRGRMAAAREEARRLMAERLERQARRRRLALAGGATGLVLVAVLAMVVVSRFVEEEPAKPLAATSGAASAAGAATSVPASILDAVGKGTTLAKPKPVTGQPALTEGDKPLVMYIGAEFCPYCASQRWPVVVALSRFGTFTGLGTTFSAAEDVHPNTASLSFHGSTYRSEYLAFEGVETATNKLVGDDYAPLDELTDRQRQVMNTVNAPPYTQRKGSIPFMDLGNKWMLVGSLYETKLLAGASHQRIAEALTDPSNPIAKGILGSANMLTWYLCQLTNGRPSNVCQSPAATAYQG